MKFALDSNGRSHGIEGLLEFTWPKVIDRPRAESLAFKRPWWFPYGATQTEVLRQHTRLLGARTVVDGVRAASKMGAGVLRLLFRKPRT